MMECDGASRMPSRDVSPQIFIFQTTTKFERRDELIEKVRKYYIYWTGRDVVGDHSRGLERGENGSETREGCQPLALVIC